VGLAIIAVSIAFGAISAFGCDYVLRTHPLELLPFAGIARAADEPPAEKADAKLLALHRDEASRWEIFVDPAQTKKAVFVADPIYRWTNASRANGQTGAMFVWTSDGRPVAIGGVFSNPEAGRRVIMHEFHALGSKQVYARTKDSRLEWAPHASVSFFPLADAPKPEPKAARRALQMRELARAFTAHTKDDVSVTWQLRLLARPLYRYLGNGADLIEGAIFAFVSDAGTDPEVILVLEAVTDGNTESWRYRVVRYSISSLHVQYQGKEIWKSLRDNVTGVFDNPDNTYTLIRERLIDELPEITGRRDKAP
jgi:hypothetical protein